MTEWQPPRAPVHPPDGGLPRAPGALPRTPRRPEPVARSAAETLAIGVGAASVVLVVLSVGLSFQLSAILSAGAFWIGRRTGRRAAVVVAVIGLALSVIAGVTWTILHTHGIEPQDLRDWLQSVRR